MTCAIEWPPCVLSSSLCAHIMFSWGVRFRLTDSWGTGERKPQVLRHQSHDPSSRCLDVILQEVKSNRSLTKVVKDCWIIASWHGLPRQGKTRKNLQWQCSLNLMFSATRCPLEVAIVHRHRKGQSFCLARQRSNHKSTTRNILHFSESATLLLWGQESWSTRHRDLLPLPPMYMMIMYSWYGVAWLCISGMHSPNEWQYPNEWPISSKPSWGWEELDGINEDSPQERLVMHIQMMRNYLDGILDSEIWKLVFDSPDHCMVIHELHYIPEDLPPLLSLGVAYGCYSFEDLWDVDSAINYVICKRTWTFREWARQNDEVYYVSSCQDWCIPCSKHHSYRISGSLHCQRRTGRGPPSPKASKYPELKFLESQPCSRLFQGSHKQLCGVADVNMF